MPPPDPPDDEFEQVIAKISVRVGAFVEIHRAVEAPVGADHVEVESGNHSANGIWPRDGERNGRIHFGAGDEPRGALERPQAARVAHPRKAPCRFDDGRAARSVIDRADLELVADEDDLGAALSLEQAGNERQSPFVEARIDRCVKPKPRMPLRKVFEPVTLCGRDTEARQARVGCRHRPCPCRIRPSILPADTIAEIRPLPVEAVGADDAQRAPEGGGSFDFVGLTTRVNESPTQVCPIAFRNAQFVPEDDASRGATGRCWRAPHHCRVWLLGAPGENAAFRRGLDDFECRFASVPSERHDEVGKGRAAVGRKVDNLGFAARCSKLSGSEMSALRELREREPAVDLADACQRPHEVFHRQVLLDHIDQRIDSPEVNCQRPLLSIHRKSRPHHSRSTARAEAREQRWRTLALT